MTLSVTEKPDGWQMSKLRCHSICTSIPNTSTLSDCMLHFLLCMRSCYVVVQYYGWVCTNSWSYEPLITMLRGHIVKMLDQKQNKLQGNLILPVCESITNTHRVEPDEGYGSTGRRIWFTHHLPESSLHSVPINNHQQTDLSTDVSTLWLSHFRASSPNCASHTSINDAITAVEWWSLCKFWCCLPHGTPPVQYCKHMIERSDSEQSRVGALMQVLHLTGDLTCHPPMDALEQGVYNIWHHGDCS